MARGINKVILIGNLGQDPEVRHTPNGVAVVNMSIATNESVKDKQSGEQQTRTEWHRVVFFARLAEVVGEYLKKGSQVYVEGRLQTRKWKDPKEGGDRYSTEIIAREMQMLSGRSDSTSSAGEFNQSQPHAADSPDSKTPADDFDDDIPF